MNYWILKTEPGDYSWDDLVREKETHWDGVRNYAARNNLKAMKPGDRAFFYHSVKQRTIVGIAEIVSTWYQDPTTDDDRWVAVKVVPVKAVNKPVTLAQIKAEPRLANCGLVRISRLSVVPLEEQEAKQILVLAGE